MVFLLSGVIAAAMVPEQVEEALPQGAEELWEDLEGNTDHTAFFEGLSLLWKKVGEFCTADLESYLKKMAVLLTAVLLCGVIEDCIKSTDHQLVANYAPMAGVLVITATAVGDMESMMGLAYRTIEELDVFSKAFLPTLAAATAAGGGMVSASVRQVGTVAFANVLMTLIHRVLMPMVYCYIALLSADTILPDHPLKSLAGGIKKGMTWVLTGGLTLFTGYLTISGAVATASDSLAAQVTQSAISAAVPVVGTILSQAAGSVLAGASALKNSIGVFGVLAILAASLMPFLTIGTQYLLYKLTSFLSGTLGQNALVEYLNALGGAFGLVLGMVASCVLLLLLSAISFLSVVVI